MSPEQAELLRERQEGFDDFYQALMPGLVEFVGELGITPAHMVLKQAEHYVKYVEEGTQDLEIESEKDHTAFLIPMAWFIGEVFVQKLRGCWFVDDLTQSRYFASYVVGKFKQPINPLLRIDPFGMAKEYIESPRPRKLVALLKEVEEGVRKA